MDPKACLLEAEQLVLSGSRADLSEAVAHLADYYQWRLKRKRISAAMNLLSPSNPFSKYTNERPSEENAFLYN
jgi:hypothetical protein